MSQLRPFVRPSAVRRLRRAVSKVPARFQLTVTPTVADKVSVTLTPVGRGAATMTQQQVVAAVVQAVTRAPVQGATLPPDARPGVTPPPPSARAAPLSVSVPRFIHRNAQIQVIRNIERNPLFEFGLLGMLNDLNNRIIQRFARQETYAGRLGANTVRWNRYKAKHGLDLRRGHATLRMARAMASLKFYSLRWSRDSVLIEWSDAPLIAAVDYAEHYIDQKCPGGRLAGVRRTDWRNAVTSLGRW